MTFEIKVSVNLVSDRFIDASKKNISYTATRAMTDVAEYAKSKGRSNIASSGFSTGWQQALRSVVYPKRKTSTRPAAIIYHNIPYAGAFEKPTLIQARVARYLWIPVKDNKLIGTGRNKLTPRKWINTISNLQFVKLNNTPTLVIKDKGKLNKSGLKAGTPVFIGVTSVQLKKRFDITGAAQNAANNISSFFDARFKKDNN